jgi:hypothetical protein
MDGYLELLALVAMIGAFFVQMVVDKKRVATRAKEPVPTPDIPSKSPPVSTPIKSQTTKSEPSKKAEPPKKAATVKKVDPPKKVATVKKVEPPKKAEPAKIVAPSKKAEPAKKVAPPKKAEPAKKAPPAKSVKAKKTPAKPAKKTVTVAESITDDAIICLICGKSNKLLKTHLKRTHKLEPEQYIAQFKLPADYPMSVAKKAK